VINIRLIHWDLEEARRLAERLDRARYEVAFELGPMPALLKELKANPPGAVVIDLSRLPSHGRDVGVALRLVPSTRRVPLVFVGGDPLKVSLVRAKLPDATYTAWDAIETSLAEAIAAPRPNPIAMHSQMDGYSGKPLVTKLGIKPGMRVALVNPPPDFAATLGQLPAGVELHSEVDNPSQLMIWFVRSLAELRAGLGSVASRLGSASLWIAWPKKTSPLAADVGEQDVREGGLAIGLVDFKVCAIDATWSGLLFRWRKLK
jgi:hypothetical protein